MLFEYDTRDYLVDILCEHHRSDLARYVPLGGQRLDNVETLFWRDVSARFRRGEVWDAVTAIERRFRPRDSFVPTDVNAYVFMEAAQ